MMQQIDLPTGRIEVHVHASTWPLASLCGFAGRNNPRRGFLFVSRVLGKHVPCSAAHMSAVHHQLASMIDADVLSDALVIGMAETATGLGHGVFEACLQLEASSRPALYLQSTRYPLSNAQSLDFQEEHSHAAQQWLYLPEQPQLRERFDAARSVILVDDEISTGRTLANLVAALRRTNPRIEHVVLVCLTDFSQGKAQDNMAAVPGVRSVRTVALLHGSFRFKFAPDFVAPAAAPAFAPMDCRRGFISAWSARLGIAQALAFPTALVAECTRLCRFGEQRTGRVLVLGTGEFMHGAYVLARALAQQQIDAVVQSTTRSPILLGADVSQRIELPDPYGEGIANFVYNVVPDDYAHIFVVHETPRNEPLLALCNRLGAHAVSLADHVLLPAPHALGAEVSA